MGTRCFTLKQRALLSCIFPILTGSILICGIFIDPDSPAFVSVCIIIGSVAISTGLLGMLGVASKLVVAIEVTQPLLAVENFISIVIGILILVDLLVFRRYLPSAEPSEPEETTTTVAPTLLHPENVRMATFLSPKGASGEQYLLQHRWIGYVAASCLILTGLLGFVTTEMLGSYKTELSIEAMVQERKGLWKEFDESRPPREAAEEKLLEHPQTDREQRASVEET